MSRAASGAGRYGVGTATLESDADCDSGKKVYLFSRTWLIETREAVAGRAA